MTVREAADELGITVEAVRGRIKRGKLDHEKASDGTVYVWIQAALPRDQTATGYQPDDDQSSDQPRQEPPLSRRRAHSIVRGGGDGSGGSGLGE